MDILKKIVNVLIKVIAGILAFYLVVALIIIPLICPKIIQGQVSKNIGHEARVRSVQFNPFLWKLKIKGFEILDSKKQVIIGFDEFWADVSFIALCERKYHIESLGLSGIQVNVVRLDNGTINLLGLIPAKTNNQMPESADKKADKLPLVKIDLISIDNSRISFTDQSVDPFFSVALSSMNLKVTGLSTLPDCRAKISFSAMLNEKGWITDEALVSPFALPISLENVFKLNEYMLQTLTPYVEKYTGRAAKSGKLNLTMEYRVADNKLDAKHKILIQGFNFGDKVSSKDALNLPFGLALALLQDANGKINISLPIDGDISKPDFHYFKLVGQVARNFFLKLMTKPFTFLASLVGGENSGDEFGYIDFIPGKKDLSDAEKEKIKLLVKALKERPSLALKVKKCYDPVSDWQAIRNDVFDNELLAYKKESKRKENWMYEEMYEHRFGMIALWNLTRNYRLQSGEYDFSRINAEIKRRLVEDGAPNKSALEALAAARAQAAYDLIVSEGFDSARISIGELQETQVSNGFIPVELELKVSDSSQNTAADPVLPKEVNP